MKWILRPAEAKMILSKFGIALNEHVKNGTGTRYWRSAAVFAEQFRVQSIGIPHPRNYAQLVDAFS
ncbi:MAG: hypothetical protein GDA36_12055 [Rhodobacteraceae bacterium]|nr:hypothetical protein [Paracoccaceae bacterium]